MLISGETARYERTRLNLHCLQKTSKLPLALKELIHDIHILLLRPLGNMWSMEFVGT